MINFHEDYFIVNLGRTNFVYAEVLNETGVEKTQLVIPKPNNILACSRDVGEGSAEELSIEKYSFSTRCHTTVGHLNCFRT